MAWIVAHWTTILLVLGFVGWFFDNVLSGIPALKSNSTFELVCNILDTIVRKAKGTQSPLALIEPKQ